MKNKLLVIITIILIQTSESMAALNIEIQRGSKRDITIALSGFSNQENIDIVSVISNNFESCDGFKITEYKSHPEEIDVNQIPRFNAWKASGIDAVVVGKIKNNDNKTELTYRLWDTSIKKQLSGKVITLNQKNWRRVAHIISDDIYQSFTGEKGHFDTKITYISESGPYTKKIRRLAIMDQDGANHQYLTNGDNIVLTPRFSPNNEKIVYMEYKNNTARLYTKDIITGENTIIADFKGVHSAPRFSPDGSTIIMAISKDGATNIHTMNTKTSKLKKLTKYNAISTSPSYSPDGKYIVFASDRGGKIQLYKMNNDGSSIKRISFNNGSYSAPVWSPRGDYIAFTKSYDGDFYIGIMSPDGKYERLLAKGYMVEGASWSPNGRMIIFNRQEKIPKSNRTKNVIVSLDIVSGTERNIKTPFQAIDPSWSYFLE